MNQLNRDEIYLICKKLKNSAILNLSSTNKNLRQKIIFHDKILKNGIIQIVRISMESVLKYGSDFAISFPSKDNISEKGAKTWAMEVLMKYCLASFLVKNE